VELINLRIYVHMSSVNLLLNIFYKLELPFRYLKKSTFENIFRNHSARSARMYLRIDLVYKASAQTRVSFESLTSSQFPSLPSFYFQDWSSSKCIALNWISVTAALSRRPCDKKWRNKFLIMHK
jgi:hypothetical protein